VFRLAVTQIVLGALRNDVGVAVARFKRQNGRLISLPKSRIPHYNIEPGKVARKIVQAGESSSSFGKPMIVLTRSNAISIMSRLRNREVTP
jgi:hypothetical protein